MSDYPTFYTFNINRRKYPTAKTFSGGPIYAEHFEPVVVIGENDKEYQVENGGVVNKRSGKYAPHEWSKERLTLYTEEERTSMIWMNSHKHKLIRQIENCRDVATLRAIAQLVGYKGDT